MNNAALVNVGLGCNSTDFANFPSGAVALIARAAITPCGVETKVNNSIAAGAAAVLMYYEAPSGLFSTGLSWTPPIPVSFFELLLLGCIAILFVV